MIFFPTVACGLIGSNLYSTVQTIPMESKSPEDNGERLGYLVVLEVVPFPRCLRSIAGIASIKLCRKFCGEVFSCYSDNRLSIQERF